MFSQIGDDYFTFITECKDPKACTILLRGPSKDILNEVERNLHDALGVARNLVLEPFLVPGGGAVEMAVSHILQEKAKTVSGVKQWPYTALGQALEVNWMTSYRGIINLLMKLVSSVMLSKVLFLKDNPPISSNTLFDHELKLNSLIISLKFNTVHLK